MPDPDGFAVGQPVVLHFGPNDFPARIVEDRGPLGLDGERIWRIEIDFEGYAEPDEMEVPARVLDPA